MEKKGNASGRIRDKAALIFLRHPGTVYTRSDIQHMLGVSKSTAVRVLADLSEMIDLQEQTEGQTVYYSLTEDDAERIHAAVDFVLAVSDKERLALSFLLNREYSQGLFPGSIKSLGEKLGRIGLLASQPDMVMEAEGNPQSTENSDEYIIDTLINALETRTEIEIRYKGAYSDSIKTHTLHPAGLYLRNGNLYLYAYDPEYGDATSYAYSRIRSISLNYDRHYTLPQGISMKEAVSDPFGISMSEPRRVRVHIHGKQVFFEKEKKWPDGTVITDCPDGSIIIELTIADPFAFRSWALSLGKYCKVEEPADLAEWIKAEHEEALQLYEN